jgi:hypothetical protein
MRFARFIGLLLLGLCAALPLGAQDEELDIDTRQHCLYKGEKMPPVLVRFEGDPDIEGLCDDILRKTGTKGNFELICTNVPSIAAVVDKKKRYILYSRKFFNQMTEKALRTALFAHAIGHHANEHLLAAGKASAQEEMEANEFMGYALCLNGVPETALDSIASFLYNDPFAHQTSTNVERRSDIQHGFRRADASLRNAEHASWFENNVNEVVKNFPKFPIPAPEPSTSCNLDTYFARCNTMGCVEEKLRHALEATGYHTRRYFYVPNGFALLTGMEQFNKNGSCKGEEARWSSRIVRCEGFSPMCYLESLVTSEPGYFRVFAFVVTPVALQGAAPAPRRDEVTNWLAQGANKLPPEIGGLPFDARRANVTAMVYEFKIPESTRKPIVSTPSEVDCLKQLTRSKILQNVRR